jgi:hypothetical protein
MPWRGASGGLSGLRCLREGPPARNAAPKRALLRQIWPGGGRRSNRAKQHTIQHVAATFPGDVFGCFPGMPDVSNTLPERFNTRPESFRDVAGRRTRTFACMPHVSTSSPARFQVIFREIVRASGPGEIPGTVLETYWNRLWHVCIARPETLRKLLAETYFVQRLSFSPGCPLQQLLLLLCFFEEPQTLDVRFLLLRARGPQKVPGNSSPACFRHAPVVHASPGPC